MWEIRQSTDGIGGDPWNTLEVLARFPFMWLKTFKLSRVEEAMANIKRNLTGCIPGSGNSPKLSRFITIHLKERLYLLMIKWSSKPSLVRPSRAPWRNLSPLFDRRQWQWYLQLRRPSWLLPRGPGWNVSTLRSIRIGANMSRGSWEQRLELAVSIEENESLLQRQNLEVNLEREINNTISRLIGVLNTSSFVTTRPILSV